MRDREKEGFLIETNGDDDVLTSSLLRLNHMKLRDVIETLEVEVRRPFSNMEVAFLEREYIRIELQMWLRESLQKVSNFLESIDDICTAEKATLVEQLHLLRSFRDISKLAPGSRVIDWCGGQRLHLILGQIDQLDTSHHATNQFSICLHQFTGNCIEALSHWLADTGAECGVEKHAYFVSALNDLLSLVSDGEYHPVLIRQILSEDVLDKLEGKTAQE